MDKNIKRALLSVLYILAFSFCIVLMSEYIQQKEMSEVLGFIAEKAGVVFFCTAILFFFTMSVIYLTKSAFAGSAVSGIFAYILSCVEYYKYSVSGSHLVVADLGFVFNAGKIAGFADIKPEAHLVRALAGLVLLLIIMYHVKMPMPRAACRSVAGSVMCITMIAALISPSSASDRTYSILNFDTEPALTTVGMNERFENDGFLGFLSQNATEFIGADISPPDGYSQELMDNIAGDAEGSAGRGTRPNVVIIASESFADLRDINEELIPDYAYDGFDRAAKLGTIGECALPTFGGYTVRSEFELLFGLPALSMSNVPSPHSMLDKEREQNTLVDIYRRSGYRTLYIHPFDRSFYDRDEVYAKYGFDEMLFGDDFDSHGDMFRRYVSDGAVMERIGEKLEQEDEPCFVFAMTMQNHQPYIEEDGSISDELDYYLKGIERSSNDLYDFLTWLSGFPEETIVLFVGDHLPFFTPQGGVYERLGAYDGTVESLYTQKYILYSNRGKIEFQKDGVSLFYLPHMLIDAAGIGYGRFTGAMLDIMEEEPVYSIAANEMGESERLDAITYDRTIGECYLE